MTAVYLCECKHAKGVHQGMTYWCREPGCTCKRYTPDFAAATITEVPITETPFGGESTSARLRRVTEQRDGLVQVVEQLSDDVLKLAAALKLAQAELASARAELEQLRGDLGVKRVGELEEQLALADPQGAVISRQRRYLCETCGSRYGIDYTDQAHGPLTPVVVTITRQGATP